MRTVFRSCRVALTVLFVAALASRASAQDAVTLAEPFKPGHTTKVEVQVKLTGKLALPSTEKGKAPQLVPVSGTSKLVYEERLLKPEDTELLKTVRAYRDVSFERTVGEAKQDAGLRPSVRRMVIIKAGAKKAPFSPDGPLTWGEIDVVRTDVFNPALVPGLLPPDPVKPGQSWKATAAAVSELTDMEKIEEGTIAVELVGFTKLNNRRLARLKISGTVRGVNEDGPNRQKLEGTAYFDLDSNLLTYLSVRGTHELLDGKAQTVGVIEGQFTMTRTPVAQMPSDLSDPSLRDLELKPNAENTLLLYDNTDLGVRFLYPRGWRIGAVQGKQVTLDHARGGGILITLEPPAKVPAPDDYLKEVTGFLTKEKAQITATEKPEQIRAEPVQLDRFSLDATFGTEKVRLEYAVLKQTDGGVTVAARLPAADTDIRSEVTRIVRSLSVTKKIEEKK
ncbi:Uncharacterized protein OS=Pirellula staleyi (strain ATCC 27377 / DSM 6068 / ICPB 4128) GN=Psta_2561 PE=4 SV=1 [Gemmata massiliana]|uniref:Uncharacterized protein n=1 Tax=Gemmata massiliana TaxID=1210884 RepID=A0A6P2CWY5_9BACT|nr:hypothetical protein [Gemmata massiliana]VTR93459.1 Uncharacterized protein OS=Pirellula staleyi (strain ATCC 27377 / DSM 6068 / ICPB 4128) GN=Psta_2561 PE=4 SV=1 [Gemmata massiliana]